MCSVAGNVLVSCEPAGRRGVRVCVALWQGMCWLVASRPGGEG